MTAYQRAWQDYVEPLTFAALPFRAAAYAEAPTFAPPPNPTADAVRHLEGRDGSCGRRMEQDRQPVGMAVFLDVARLADELEGRVVDRRRLGEGFDGRHRV